MEESDYAEVLDHIRAELRESNLADVDQAAFTAIDGGPDVGARDVLFSYLNLLERELRLRSAGTAQEALRRLNEDVRTTDGLPVEGFEVILDPAARVFARRDSFDLSELPDLSREIAALRQLRTEIMES